MERFSKMDSSGSHLLRIGIFYDGNYFYHVCNYYCYVHPKRARLSISGLHGFIRRMVAEKEDCAERLCQIVDCHYFRGRLSAQKAQARQLLLNERVFDDILMREGVVTHYFPVTHGVEKGVDVALALEALEQTLFKQYNVVVLIVCDGDYIPLVRKLNAIGTRVMVLGWDFEYTDENGALRKTITSPRLLNEVSYPLDMRRLIDALDPAVQDTLFVMNPGAYEVDPDDSDDSAESTEEMDSDLDANALPEPEEGEELRGRIVQLKKGYGFISTEKYPKNLFFYCEDLENCEYSQLQISDEVLFRAGRNMRGICAKNIRIPEKDGVAQ